MQTIHFISPNIDEDFFKKKDINKTKYLYKTMPLENALKTIKKGLWFAKPSTWTDPFEKRFYSAKSFRDGNKPINNPLKNKFLCCCMTSIGQSEAHWNTYSREQIGIQFQFYREKLYSFLCTLPTKYHIFIGYAQYQKKDEIKAPITQNPLFLSQKFHYKKDEDLAKLLLLKRRAFKYEEEIRFIIANKKRAEYKQAGIAIHSPQKNFLDTIYAIKISPNCPKETASFLKTYLPQITGEKIKIIQNHLYDDTEKNRTIIISK